MENLRKLIREVPDFPKPGINFYDITTLLKDAEGLKETIDALLAACPTGDIDTVIAATAIVRELTVVTTDSDFQRVPGISTLWVDRADLRRQPDVS